jgi:hypothetical protein
MHRLTLRSAAALVALLSFAAACTSEGGAYKGPYEREVNLAIPAIEKSAGFPFKRMPKVETRSKDEVRGFLEKKFDESTPALELAGAERAYKLLGLLPDSLDLRKFMLKLLAEQVVGYYDPATKVLYVVDGADKKDGGEILRVTISHELVHALQDQYANLDSLEKLHGDNDRQSTMQAVMEGQATYEQLASMVGGQSALNMPGSWERVRRVIRDAQGTMPIFASAPMLIQETLLFPYLSGAEYVKGFKEKRSGQLPYAPLPQSTEQILHPEKFLTLEDAPLRLRLPKPNAGSVVYDNDLGEFETRLFLYQHLKDLGVAGQGADGWGGDRYLVVNAGSGAGITWLSLWDTPIDAAQFRDAVERTIERRFGTTPGSGGSGNTRRFTAKGRTIEVTAAMVLGKAAVLYTDVPAGASTNLIDLAKVTLEKP